jgi:hypothetical protein
MMHSLTTETPSTIVQLRPAMPRRLVSANPADDLAETRAEILRLKAREEALIDLLVARPELREAGRTCHVELAFMADPRAGTTPRPIVTCHPLRGADVARPGWPIRRAGGAAVQ